MFTLNCKGRLLSLEKPVVMGIINITPDSFHAPSRVQQMQQVLEKAEQMIAAGAAILDIGGQSTRPNSEWLDADTEWERLVDVLPRLTAAFPETIFSIDTFHHIVARKAIDAGAHLVNDVSGGQLDEQMISTVGELGVPYVCMHMRGTPQTMGEMTHYDNIIVEMVDYFIDRIRLCREAGIKDIIIDPGFGFAKKGAQNFEVLQQLEAFAILDCPLLLGVSRKSMVTKTLGITAAEALNGTTVLHTIGLLKGANILRVHDVKEALQAILLVEALLEQTKNAGR
jgi:dihydropteroate synthase